MPFPLVGFDFLLEEVNGIGELCGNFGRLVCGCLVAIVFHLEHGYDALSAGDVLIEGDGLLLVATDGQEVVDVLVVGEGGSHEEDDDGDGHHHPEA